jgi:hypothetical protein
MDDKFADTLLMRARAASQLRGTSVSTDLWDWLKA